MAKPIPEFETVTSAVNHFFEDIETVAQRVAAVEWVKWHAEKGAFVVKTIPATTDN